jgi:predicted PurR-regulated permease PerM
MSVKPTEVSWIEIAAGCLAGLGLLLIVVLRLLPALVAGLLVYEIVHVLAPPLQSHVSRQVSRIAVVAGLIAVVVSVIAAAVVSALAFVQSEAGSVPMLLEKLAEIIDRTRSQLPGGLSEQLPEDVEHLQEAMAAWLRAHAHDVRIYGAEIARTFVQIVLGMAIGAMLSLRHARPMHEGKPLAQALGERATRFSNAFRQVVFAQVRISAINTAATAVYLAGILPMLGINLPLKKTLIAVTFVTGLIPVIGNLFSNTAIVVVSLSHSLYIALGSLAFLVAIHKMEYFLNARIVGVRVHAKAWELLIAMVAMEAAFGITGLVAAPIYYAYVKRELSDRGLV